jgi:YHYH protein
VALVAAVAGCGGTAVAVTASRPAASPTRYATTPTSKGVVNPAAIPLGDGYVSTTPKAGYVDSCVTHFPPAGGAQVEGPWINETKKTWDSLTKVAVQGAVKWPAAYYRVTVKGDKRVIKFNDLPIDHTTGVFPIRPTDPAYAYDRNPNHIAAHPLDWKLPLHPKLARRPSCTSGGPIGVLDDGVVFFNALDGEGRDAGAHEVLDRCQGHPQMQDMYHHHTVPSCILDRVRNGRTALVGYAIDGFGIYVEKSANGTMPGNSQLDACHGTTSRVLWDGKMTRIYHYVATLEYPYTVGCFRGTPLR